MQKGKKKLEKLQAEIKVKDEKASEVPSEVRASKKTHRYISVSDNLRNEFIKTLNKEVFSDISNGIVNDYPVRIGNTIYLVDGETTNDVTTAAAYRKKNYKDIELAQENERSLKENAIYPLRKNIDNSQISEEKQFKNSRLVGLYSGGRTNQPQLQSNQEQSSNDIEGISGESNNRQFSRRVDSVESEAKVNTKEVRKQVKLTKDNEIDDVLTPEEEAEIDKWVNDLLDIDDIDDNYFDNIYSAEDVIRLLQQDPKKSQQEIDKEDEERKAKKEPFLPTEENIIKLNELLPDSVKAFFKDSVIKSDRLSWFDGKRDGKYLIPMFHGTPDGNMYFFDSNRIGTNGVQRGYGFYLTDNLAYAQGYTEYEGKVIAAFVNITNPMSDTKLTLNKNQIKKFIKEFVDTTGDGVLSAYGDAYSDYEGTLNKAVENIFKYNTTDAEIINEIYGNAINDISYDDFFNEVTKRFGFDGILFKNRAEGTIVIAFRSNQIKDINNPNPTTNPDIRYSVKDTETIVNRKGQGVLNPLNYTKNREAYKK